MPHELEPETSRDTTISLLRTVEALVELQGVLRKALAAATDRERLLQTENERLRAKCCRYETADLERRRYEEEG